MIKIDAEGTAVEVLEGSAFSTARHQPVLMIEWVKSKRRNWRPDPLMELMSSSKPG